MNKITLLMIITASLIPQFSHADRIFGIYAGAYVWVTDASGGIESRKLVSLENYSLLIDEDSTTNEKNNAYYLAIEHPLPFVPNIKLTQTNISHKGTSIETYDSFGGGAVPITNTFSGTVNLDNTDITLYYEVLDNMISLDLGLAVREFTGELDTPKSILFSQPTAVEATLGLVYGKFQLDFPGSDLAVGTELYWGDNNTESALDINAYLSYESPIGIGTALGYRMLDTDIDTKAKPTNDRLTVDFDVEGFYLSLFYHL